MDFLDRVHAWDVERSSAWRPHDPGAPAAFASRLDPGHSDISSGVPPGRNLVRRRRNTP